MRQSANRRRPLYQNLVLLWLATGLTAYAQSPPADYFRTERPRAESLDKQATVYYAAGQYAAAEPLYREALALLIEPNALAAIVANNLAALLLAQGRLKEAEPLYGRA